MELSFDLEDASQIFVGAFALAVPISFSEEAWRLVVSPVLFCLNKLPLLEDPVVAFKRVVVIALPASMGAIVVDSFDKE